MDKDVAVIGGSGGEREVVVYVLRGELEDGGDGKVTYSGSSRNCIVLK